MTTPDGMTLAEQTARRLILAHIGIDDDEERAVYVYQLAGVPHGGELTPEDLDRVLTALVDCETIGHIQEITGQGTL